MKRAIAVIGAAWGDEGKGLMTDFFCRQAGEEPMVVRFCGGANAGHTVVTPERDRHVFHHFGAGTLAGARTYLSRYFLVNPVLWKTEYEELQGRGLRLRLFVDREAPVTTVFDMIANQKVEESRPDRHGSCGVGIHATMIRQEAPALRIFAGDLHNPSYLRDRVYRIATFDGHFVPDEALAEAFLADCKLMGQHINLCDSRVLADRNAEIVFEGSQGLLLDQDNTDFFPHLTHAKTGLHNVMKIAQQATINQIDAVYVTRSYLTRHGAGMLPGEDSALSYFDDTNVENAWQGKLRFAPMNTSLVSDAIMHDLAPVRVRSDVNVTPFLAVTHMDQCPWRGWKVHEFESHGPTYRDVRDMRRR